MLSGNQLKTLTKHTLSHSDCNKPLILKWNVLENSNKSRGNLPTDQMHIENLL